MPDAPMLETFAPVLPEKEDPTGEVAVVEPPAPPEVAAETPPAEAAPVPAQEAVASPELIAAQEQAATLQAQVQDLMGRLATYQLADALSAASLPTEAGPLVRKLYAAEAPAQELGAWLTAQLADSASPLAVLSMLKASAKAPQTDPSSTTPADDAPAPKGSAKAGKPVPSF